MRRFLLLAALTVLAAGPALAQAAYPNKPITVIVPFAAGGPTDVVARLVGEHMSRTLGQQLVVENVGGAGGTHRHDARRRRRRPTATPSASATWARSRRRPRSIPTSSTIRRTSFEQIGIVNFTPQAIVAKKDTAAKRPQGLHRLPQGQQHQKLSYGHAGVGSISHVSGTLFNAQFGLKPALVAYRGTAPALNDLVGGQIDYMVDQSLNVIPQIKGGTIKAYAIAAPARLESLPDVPTTKEAGRRLHLQRLERHGRAQGHAEGHRRQARRRAEQGARRSDHQASATSSSAARPRRAPTAARPACRSWSRARWRASRPVLKAALAAATAK